MIGMSFSSFLLLLVEAFIAAAVLHYILRYRVLECFDGFLAKLIAGWLGAWLGSPVLGHWSVKRADICLIPALLGAFAASFALTATYKAHAKACSHKSEPKAA